MSTTDEELQALRDEVEAKRTKLADTAAETASSSQQNNNDIYADQLRAESARLDREIADEEYKATLSPVSVPELPPSGDPEQAMRDAIDLQKQLLEQQVADEAAAAAEAAAVAEAAANAAAAPVVPDPPVTSTPTSPPSPPEKPPVVVVDPSNTDGTV